MRIVGQVPLRNPLTALAQVRCVVEARRSDVLMSLLQALRQAFTTAL